MRVLATICLIAGLAIGPVYGVACGLQRGDEFFSHRFELTSADSGVALPDDGTATSPAVEPGDDESSTAAEETQTASGDAQPVGSRLRVEFPLAPEMTPVRIMATTAHVHEVGKRRNSTFQVTIRQPDGTLNDSRLQIGTRGRRLTRPVPDNLVRSERLLATLDVSQEGFCTVTLQPQSGNTLPLAQLTVTAWRNAARLQTPVVIAGGVLMFVGLGLYMVRVEPQVRDVLSSLETDRDPRTGM